MSLLHEVTACGDVDRLEDLLTKGHVNKNERDEDWEGRTPLFWATIEGHLSCVKLLLEAGANPTLRNNTEKTVAHYASESGRCDILKVLIEYGCDLTVSDKYGDTAMDYALLYGHLECAALINKALRKDFNFKVMTEEWTSDPNTAISPKTFRQDICHSKKLLSLLAGLKSFGNDHDTSDGNRTPTKRRKSIQPKLRSKTS